MDALTRQDLIYAAHALRVSAGQSEQRCNDPVFMSSHEIFRNAAKSQRELADKFERVAKRMPHQS